jgi:L-methionine (R)-S-oxide reductase
MQTALWGSFLFMYNKELDFIQNKTKNLNLTESLQFICDYLKNNIEGYDWVGFYFHEDSFLVLKNYCGLKTEHTRIPFGKGICGQTAESNKPIVVENVNNEKNYISCNINVKSEIVVPLFYKNKNIGQNDIDSNTLNRFKNDDLEFLEKVNKIVAKKFKFSLKFDIFFLKKNYFYCSLFSN